MEVFTVKQAADQLGTSTKALQDLIEEQVIDCYRMGRKVYLSERQIDAARKVLS